MMHWAEFDHVVINDDLDVAIETMQAIITGHKTENLSRTADISDRLNAILEA